MARKGEKEPVRKRAEKWSEKDEATFRKMLQRRMRLVPAFNHEIINLVSQVESPEPRKETAKTAGAA